MRSRDIVTVTVSPRPYSNKESHDFSFLPSTDFQIGISVKHPRLVLHAIDVPDLLLMSQRFGTQFKPFQEFRTYEVVCGP